MYIHFISGASPGGYGSRLPTAGTRPAQAAPGSTSEGPGADRTDTVTLSTTGPAAEKGAPAQSLKEAPSVPDVLKVTVERRKDGVQLVTLYDPRTGSILAQLPPEQVIRAVDEALRAQAEKEGPA